MSSSDSFKQLRVWEMVTRAVVTLIGVSIPILLTYNVYMVRTLNEHTTELARIREWVNQMPAVMKSADEVTRLTILAEVETRRSALDARYETRLNEIASRLEILSTSMARMEGKLLSGSQKEVASSK